METLSYLNTEGLKLLRKPTEREVIVDVYKDRAIVTVSKRYIGHLVTLKHKYVYYITSKFVYEGRTIVKQKDFYVLKQAIQYAEALFVARNTYMETHGYTLKE